VRKAIILKCRADFRTALFVLKDYGFTELFKGVFPLLNEGVLQADRFNKSKIKKTM